jgi:hypothetical protein
VGWLRECDYVNSTLVTRDSKGDVLMRKTHFGTTPGGGAGCVAR